MQNATYAQCHMSITRSYVQRSEPVPGVPLGADQLRVEGHGPQPAVELQGPLEADRRPQPEPSRLLRGEVQQLGTREHTAVPLRDPLFNIGLCSQLAH